MCSRVPCGERAVEPTNKEQKKKKKQLWTLQGLKNLLRFYSPQFFEHSGTVHDTKTDSLEPQQSNQVLKINVKIKHIPKKVL